MAEYVALNAKLYAKSSGVTNESANEVAEFSGDVSIGFTDEYAEWFGTAMTRQGATQTKMDAPITISGLAFKPAILESVWGATKSTSDNLKSAGAEAADSYTFSSSTTAAKLEFLIDCTIDDKHLQIFVEDGYMQNAPLTLTNTDYATYDTVTILPIDEVQLVKILVEQ